MDYLKELINNIKDRFSNPLIISFILSWLVSNWKITYALFWNPQKQIVNAGYKNTFDFIESNINWFHSFWIPITAALVYTFCFPIIRREINLIYTRIEKGGENRRLKILDGGKISIDKYFSLKKLYEKNIEILEDTINSESKHYQLFIQTKNDLATVNMQKDEMDIQLKEYEKYQSRLFDSKLLNDTWEVTYEHVPKSGKENIKIVQNDYLVLSDIGEYRHIFDIKNFLYNSKDNTVFFVKELVSEQKKNRAKEEHYCINRLRFEGEDILTGTENEKRIKYQRKTVRNHYIN